MWNLVIEDNFGETIEFKSITNYVEYEESICFTYKGWHHTYFNLGMNNYSVQEIKDMTNVTSIK